MNCPISQIFAALLAITPAPHPQDGATQFPVPTMAAAVIETAAAPAVPRFSLQDATVSNDVRLVVATASVEATPAP